VGNWTSGLVKLLRQVVALVRPTARRRSLSINSRLEKAVGTADHDVCSGSLGLFVSVVSIAHATPVALIGHTLETKLFEWERRDKKWRAPHLESVGWSFSRWLWLTHS